MRHFVSYTRLRGAGAGSGAGARHDSAGRVAIADTGVPPRAVIHAGRGRCSAPRSTAGRGHKREQMSTWRRHRAHRNSRASSIAPPGEEGWTIRDHPAILHSEPYASADLGAASDVTAKSVQSEAASASSPTPISLQLTSDVIAGTRGARLLWQAASAQGGNNDTSHRRARWDDSALVRFDRHSQFTRAVRQITAHFHSHQQVTMRNVRPGAGAHIRRPRRDRYTRGEASRSQRRRIRASSSCACV